VASVSTLTAVSDSRGVAGEAVGNDNNDMLTA
jgi:hypothetical protein